MGRRRKPTDPMEIMRQRAALLAAQEEARRLEGQGVTVKKDHAGRVLSAYRSNVFNLLQERGTITPNQYDACCRMRDQWATWKKLDGALEQGL